MKTLWKNIAIITVVVLVLAANFVLAEEDVDFYPLVKIDEGATVVDTSQFKTDPPWTIAFSNQSVANSWRVQLVEEAKYQATLHPEIEEFIVTDAQGNASKQISDIEDLLAQDIDALLIAAVSPTAPVGIINRAMAEGVPVIVFNYRVETDNYVTSIQGDPVHFGQAGMEWLAEELGGEGDILALRGIPGNSDDTGRWQGVENVLEENPGINVVGSAHADWAYDKARVAMENLLAAHPDIDGIWSSGGAMTQAAAEALLAANRPLVPMTGESNNGFFRTWIEYDIPSIAPEYPTWMSAEAVKAAVKILKGLPVHSDYIIRPEPITREKAEEIYRPDYSDNYWPEAHLTEDILDELYK
ncbi:MAG TPA: ABC transporter substrate-binding protein [Halanaerobiales bacterium]|nr:ABC transporter substrate-binding protein [Halanaerobiales bacterium]